MNDGLALTIGLVLLVANGFFVTAEFAVITARRHKLERIGGTAGPLGRLAARTAVRGSRELSLMLAGAQLGVTMCTLLLGIVVEPAIAHLLAPVMDALAIPAEAQHPIAFVAALVLVTFSHMVLGEMAPKSWALTHPEAAALGLALPFRAFTTPVRPLLSLLNGFTNVLLRLCRVSPRDELSSTRTPGQLAMLVGESGRTGALAPEEHQLLTRALRVQEMPVSRVMVDLDQAASVPAYAGADRITAACRATGFLRLPVRDGTGAVLGVLHVRDVVGGDPEVTAHQIAYPVPRLPSHTTLPEAVDLLQRARSHLALVTAPGSREVLGMVSQTDLIGQLLDGVE